MQSPGAHVNARLPLVPRSQLADVPASETLGKQLLSHVDQRATNGVIRALALGLQGKVSRHVPVRPRAEPD